MPAESKDENETKTVTIRGVNKEVYNEVVRLSREIGKSVGEITNQALTLFLSIANEASRAISSVGGGVVETGKAFIEGFRESRKDITIISNIDEMEISKDELISYGKPISFRNIKRLTFTDIDQNTFENYIDSLISIEELVIPSSVNKLKLLQRSRFIKRIVINK
jgi:hypothetical protein